MAENTILALKIYAAGAGLDEDGVLLLQDRGFAHGAPFGSGSFEIRERLRPGALPPRRRARGRAPE